MTTLTTRLPLTVFAAALLAAAGVAPAATIFDNGSVQGTAVDLSDPATGQALIVVGDADLTDNVTTIQLDKTFNRYVDCGDPYQGDGITLSGGGCGCPPPPTGLPLLVEFTLPSAAAVGSGTFDILISDEQVRNNTCTPWWDYEIILAGPTDRLGFVGTPNPVDYFTTVESGPDALRFVGGVWPNDNVYHTLHQSLVGQELGIRVELYPDSELVFLLKERPSVPEPATMSVLGLGGVLAVLRRRKRARRS